ncbi:MAG: 3-deoxy-manno-octulosonate cytidylyltransferase [Flavobacteriaceae bacterium]
MSEEVNPIVVIPARMAATRLPGKPLADLGGRPMIAVTAAAAAAAGVGPVIVATDSAEIAAAVRDSGFQAVMTSPDHQSGSDRIFEAARIADPAGRHDVIVNLQGDYPLIEPGDIAAAAALLADAAVDIGTIAAEIREDGERADPNVVKVVGSPLDARRLRALYFTRATAPHGEGPHYHHIGIYAYRPRSLQRFVSLPQSVLEKRERLEQLRALEAGMRIDVALVDSVPVGVDTPADLEMARGLLAGRA